MSKRTYVFKETGRGNVVAIGNDFVEIRKRLIPQKQYTRYTYERIGDVLDITTSNWDYCRHGKEGLVQTTPTEIMQLTGREAIKGLLILLQTDEEE